LGVEGLYIQFTRTLPRFITIFLAMHLVFVMKFVFFCQSTIDEPSSFSARATNVFTMLFDPDSDSLPKRSELPDIPGAPKGAAWFWGKDDEVLLPLNYIILQLLIKNSTNKLGRLNLLTPRRRREAAKLIESGETVNLE
jgi:hypothetical protein